MRIPKIVHVKNQEIFKSAENTVKNNPNINIVIPHVCNNIGLFGAGFAESINNYNSSVKANFLMLGSKTKLGYTQFIDVYTNPKSNNRVIIANMIAQNGVIHKIKNPRPLNYLYLVACMIKVRDYINELNKKNDTITQIYTPRFGSGLAGGNWSFIENIVEDIWTNIPVYIYYKKELSTINN